MDIKEYLKKMKNIQKNILDFIESETNFEKDFQNLIIFFQQQKLKENSNHLKELLHILLKISNNHHRTPSFFSKIEQILLFFKEEIIIYYSNCDIFNIFKSNKRVLLFLFEQNIILPDKTIAQIITREKYFKKFYPHYFFPEFSTFFDENTKQKIENSIDISIYNEENYELFSENRKNGENDSIICNLIRNDSIDDFISHVKNESILLTSTIGQSIYETNSLIMKNKTTLIEYSAFFGSTQIFKFLHSKKVKPFPSIWIFSVHSQNPELIRLLEENKSKSKEKLYKDCLIESIKCHHNNIVKYISNRLLTKSIRSDFIIFKNTLKSHNYTSFPKKLADDFNILCNLCKYDYLSIVEFFLPTSKINLNQTGIQYINFLNEISMNKFNNNETILQLATEKGNKEIVIFLLSRPEIDVNMIKILTLIFFI